MLGKNHFEGNGIFNNILFVSLIILRNFPACGGVFWHSSTQYQWKYSGRFNTIRLYSILHWPRLWLQVYSNYIFNVLVLSAKTWYTFVGTILYTILILVSKSLLWDKCLLMDQHRPRIYLWCNMEQLVCSTWYHNILRLWSHLLFVFPSFVQRIWLWTGLPIISTGPMAITIDLKSSIWTPSTELNFYRRDLIQLLEQ